jgi:hypothetical protein
MDGFKGGLKKRMARCNRHSAPIDKPRTSPKVPPEDAQLHGRADVALLARRRTRGDRLTGAHTVLPADDSSGCSARCI